MKRKPHFYTNCVTSRALICWLLSSIRVQTDKISTVSFLTDEILSSVISSQSEDKYGIPILGLIPDDYLNFCHGCRLGNVNSDFLSNWACQGGHNLFVILCFEDLYKTFQILLPNQKRTSSIAERCKQDMTNCFSDQTVQFSFVS